MRLVAALMICACSAPKPTPPPQRFADHDQRWSFADPDRRKKLDAAFTTMDAAIADEMQKRGLKGLALGVVIDGELAFAKGYGVVDPAKPDAPTADTVYRIGSLSKSFTGLAVLQLRDAGKLRLDDKLADYFAPAAAIAYPSHDSSPITIRQLLTHTSGLPRDAGGYETPTEADIAKLFDGLHLEASPGTRASYSNTGFGTLSIVIAHAAGKPYREIVAEQIFKPLGMTSTSSERPAVTAPSTEKGGKQNVLGVMEGAGGIYSTVRDMAKYVALQLSAYPPRDGDESAIVHRATLREAHDTGMFFGASARVRSSGAPAMRATTYGFGWAHSHTCDADDIIEHSGHIDSFQSAIELETSRGIGVVVLSNFGDVGGVADRVLDELDKTGATKPRVAHLSPLPQLEQAMAKFLPIYNHYDAASLRPLLAREIADDEPAELAGYYAIHGACTSYTVGEVVTETNAHFLLKCERGDFDLALEMNAEGKLDGFMGTSKNITPPADIAAKIADAVSLIGTWDDAVFARTYADPTAHDSVMKGLDQVRANRTSCKVGPITHESTTWLAELDCAKGEPMLARVTFAKDKVDRFNLRPIATATDSNCH